MSRKRLLWGAVLLVAVLVTGCADSSQEAEVSSQEAEVMPPPGPIYSIFPSDGDPTTCEWKAGADCLQSCPPPPTLELPKDFIGTDVLELSCDGVEVEGVDLTMENGYQLTIRRTVFGLQWCLSAGGSFGCYIPKENGGVNCIPSAFESPTELKGDGTNCSEVRFQVELPE
jgi:hypothetical protein